MIGLLFRVDEQIGLNNESSNEKACVYTAQHKSVNHMNHPDGLFWILCFFHWFFYMWV